MISAAVQYKGYYSEHLVLCMYDLKCLTFHYLFVPAIHVRIINTTFNFSAFFNREAFSLM